MAEELLDGLGLVCRDRLVEAMGVALAGMGTSGRKALTSVARLGPEVCDAVIALIDLACEAAIDETEQLCDRTWLVSGESVAVMVTAGELIEHGLPADAIGVGWASGDECRTHALAGAPGRPAADRNARGIVLFEGMGLDCSDCRYTGVRPVGSGERAALPGELCTCGRPATVVFMTKRGDVGWCGSERVDNVTPCPFCGDPDAHDEPCGGPARCPAYRVCPTSATNTDEESR